MDQADAGAPGSRIWLDGRNQSSDNGTGVATYARVLGQSCRQLGMQPEWLIGLKSGESNGHAGRPHIKIRRLVAALRSSRTLPQPAVPSPGQDPTLLSPDLFRVAHVHFNLFRRPLLLRCTDPPALMHWTYPLPMQLAGVRNIVTIHDLIPLLQPHLTGIPQARMRRLLTQLVPRAARIVTVSETVRIQVIKQLDVPPAHVVNLFQAVNPDFDADAAADDAPPICPPGSFVFFGTVEPRKNLRRLIAAHAASGVDVPLVIIGPDGDAAASELTALADDPRAGAAVLRVPWCPRPSLIRAIREARAVLFPSLAEGFGLPIAEAMTLGTPVMTSRGGATAEVAAGAAILVDPCDVGDMAQAIRALQSDPALRERLRFDGRIRAQLFSTNAYRKRLEAFYTGLLHDRAIGSVDAAGRAQLPAARSIA